MQTNRSEVAALREQIATEYMAAKLGLQGLNAGTSRHAFMTAKLERVALLHDELQNLVGDEAMAIVTEVSESLSDTPTRSDILAVLSRELNPKERELLCSHLQEAWKALDILKERFGDEHAHKLVFAPSSPVRETPLA